jgi:hypothetical protein
MQQAYLYKDGSVVFENKMEPRERKTGISIVAYSIPLLYSVDVVYLHVCN